MENAAHTCKYCGGVPENPAHTACVFCNEIIQEANCAGIYLVDKAEALGQRADLSVQQRRGELARLYRLYGGK